MQYFADYGVPVIAARLFIHVAPGGTEHIALQEFCRQIALIELGKLPPVIRHGDLSTRRDMTDVRDSVPAMILLAEHGVPGEAYNIGSGLEYSIHDILRLAVKEAKVPGIRLEVDPARLRPYDEKSLLSDNRKLRRATCWTPRPGMPAIVRDVLQYWRQEAVARYNYEPPPMSSTHHVDTPVSAGAIPLRESAPVVGTAEHETQETQDTTRESAESDRLCDPRKYWLSKHVQACQQVYLSIVVACRNDNFGGDFQTRLQNFMRWNLHLLNKAAAHQGLTAEVVIVEWNPDPSAPRLKNIIGSYLVPFLIHGHVIVRVITAPTELHSLCPNPNHMPMQEHIAKNVGIRRSRGRFVLSTNPDDLFSEAMVEFFSKRLLNTGAYFRSFRIEEMERQLKDKSSTPDEYIDSMTRRMSAAQPSSNMTAYGLEHDAKACSKLHACRLYREEVEANRDLCRVGGFQPRGSEQNHPTLTLFGNVQNQASGDFVLMSQKDWFETGGHMEFEPLNGGLGMDDWVLCRLMHGFQKAQLSLLSPCFIVHQFHGGKQHRRGVREKTPVNIAELKGKWDDSEIIPEVIFASSELLNPHLNPDQWSDADKEEVSKSSALTKKWQGVHQHYMKAVKAFTWHFERSQPEKSCLPQGKGGFGERLFSDLDGKTGLRPTLFGFPEWQLEEVIFRSRA